MPKFRIGKVNEENQMADGSGKIEKNECSPAVCSAEENHRFYEVAADSFTGLVRKRNEDSFVYAWDADCRNLLAAVADGIGSTINGDIAGNYTLQLLVRAWRRFQFPKQEEPGPLRSFLYRTVREINRGLYSVNAVNAYDSNRDSLGTTISAAVFLRNTLIAVNAGDSPIFRIRSGQIRQLTCDHNLAAEMVRMGQLTRGEAASLPRGRMLTRFIGPKPEVEPECYVEDVLPGDYFLICSDGLTLHLSPEEICRICSDEEYELSEKVKNLFGKTIQRGAMDNVTLILVKSL